MLKKKERKICGFDALCTIRNYFCSSKDLISQEREREKRRKNTKRNAKESASMRLRSLQNIANQNRKVNAMKLPSADGAVVVVVVSVAALLPPPLTYKCNKNARGETLSRA